MIPTEPFPPIHVPDPPSRWPVRLCWFAVGASFVAAGLAENAAVRARVTVDEAAGVTVDYVSGYEWAQQSKASAQDSLAAYLAADAAADRIEAVCGKPLARWAFPP